MTITPASGGQLVLDVGQFTETGWIPPDNLTEEQWEHVGDGLKRIDSANQWWQGDWWNARPVKYQDREVSEAYCANQGLNYSSTQTYAWIANQYEISIRMEISHTHHGLVAARDDRMEWLNKAAANDWSVSKLRKEVRIADDAARTALDATDTAGSATISLADSIEWLEQLDPASADLLLTDPPYMTDVDDLDDFINAWVPLALSRVKPTGRAYIFTGAYPRELYAYLGAFLAQTDWEEPNLLVFHYPDTLGPAPRMAYAQTWQAIHYLHGWQAAPLEIPKLTEHQTVHIHNMNRDPRQFAWQKPLDLAEKLVRHGSQPGDLIIDPFAGTGTHLVAAMTQGRHAIGCDNDPERIADAQARGIAT